MKEQFKPGTKVKFNIPNGAICTIKEYEKEGWYIVSLSDGTELIASETDLVLHLQSSKLSFGKHRGKEIVDIPTDYLEWCLDQDFFIKNYFDLVSEITKVLDMRTKGHSHFYEFRRENKNGGH